MRRWRFWLRWSWRDLRARWPLVVAISLTIAMGTGLFVGLGSMETWRKQSNDESFALLNAHDLKIALAEGSFVREGELRRALASLPGVPAVADARERLVAPTQVDASRPDRSVLVPGQLVGVDLSARGRAVDRVEPELGRGLGRADARASVVVGEQGFASENGIDVGDRIVIAGGRGLRVVGTGTSPEQFLVTRAGGGEFGGAETRYAVLYVPLAIAQRSVGRPGRVNELVFTLRDSAVDRTAAADRLERALSGRFPRLGATVTPIDDEVSHRVLYKDAEGDQRLYGVFSWLILAGAAFAAFNLASRVVEAQRRELGVGMAIGVEPRALAVRPILLGAEIALLGALLGIVFGLLIRIPLRSALTDLLPLPVVTTPFDLAVFLRGAAIGFVLPLLATAAPVWRAVRVAPIDAIRVGFRSAGSSGLAPMLSRLRLPGSGIAQLPARNFLRAPRRTAMTVLGIATILAVLVSLLGLIDSMVGAVDRNAEELAGRSPDRVEIALDRFHSEQSGTLRRIAADPAVGAVEPRISMPGELRDDGDGFAVQLQLVDPASTLWRPTLVSGGFGRGARGVVIAEKAAEDLGVGVGDDVTLVHPRRVGAAAFRLERARVQVEGLHPDPFRSAVYMDRGQAAALGLAGSVNRVQAVPAAGRTSDDVQRALFGAAGVVSVERVTMNAEILDERMDEFLGVIRVVEAFGLLLALLIAFNSSSISADERVREHATMFAFGLPVRTVTALAVAEGVLVGVAATALGLLGGLALTGWVVHRVVPGTFPELGIQVHMASGSFATAAVLGVVAVGLAPLLTVRRMRRMDVPSALRVME